MMFYQLIILNDGGGKMFVPVDNVDAVGIRPLLGKTEIPRLLDRLRQSAQTSDDRKQRIERRDHDHHRRIKRAIAIEADAGGEQPNRDCKQRTDDERHRTSLIATAGRESCTP